MPASALQSPSKPRSPPDVRTVLYDNQVQYASLITIFSGRLSITWIENKRPVMENYHV